MGIVCHEKLKIDGKQAIFQLNFTLLELKMILFDFACSNEIPKILQKPIFPTE